MPDDPIAPFLVTELVDARPAKVKSQLRLGAGNKNLKLNFRNSRNFAGYCRNKVEWHRVRVPLADFHSLQ
ncbi:hypothetical protein TNCV_3142721 [Trichonephila clavipes]|nr:hypothetical protein TNCV_3142721 [Trichonephila clavipes]